MRRSWILLLCLVAAPLSAADDKTLLRWIWTADAKGDAPKSPRWFLTTFPIERFADDCVIDVTADDGYTLWFNGEKVGEGSDWKTVRRYDLLKLVRKGENVVAIEAKNAAGEAGLLAKITYTPNGKAKEVLASNKLWKASAVKPADGWAKPEFDAKTWAAAVEVAPYGQGSWAKTPVWAGGSADRFTVPAGFTVETVVPEGTTYAGLDPKAKFSLVNMCFDAKGRLFASDERGGVILVEPASEKGKPAAITKYCDVVKGAHGMCWVGDVFYLVGNGPKGAGLYKGTEDPASKTLAKVDLVMLSQGGMGEHGPHAVIHGPDDKLYWVLGNHAQAKAEKVAPTSPLLRWPNGMQGPDQNKPNTTEDVLLPRLNDANGHAANILAPGGTIWRMDKDGKNPELFSAGYRNHFDAAFLPDGELVTFDSDMEWDEKLPWYRAVRVCHATPGSDFVWRTGAANTPNYYPDSLPPAAETGRGSPTGVEVYDHSKFPAPYRGAAFLCDWSIGVIWAAIPQPKGASFTTRMEKFCAAAPMPVSDCAVGPDGCLYFTLGGRQTQGGLYKVKYAGPIETETKGGRPDQPLAAWSKGRATPLASAAGPARDVYEAGLKGDRAVILAAFDSKDPVVRRRACEAAIRAGVEVPVDKLVPMLGSQDRFEQTAARLVVQRIDPKGWAEKLLADKSERVANQAVIALTKIHQLEPFADKAFARVTALPAGATSIGQGRTRFSESALVDRLRVIELALIHAKARPDSLKAFAEQCYALFPSSDEEVDRQLAIVLAGLHRDKMLAKPLQDRLLAVIDGPAANRDTAIHYAYALRIVKGEWTPEQVARLLKWYDGTKDWKGGHSYTPFIANIVRDCLADVAKPADRVAALAKAKEMPLAALAALKNLPPNTKLPADVLAAAYANLTKDAPRGPELRAALMEAIGSSADDGGAALRKMFDAGDAATKSDAAKLLAKFDAAENLPYLVKGLEGASVVTVPVIFSGLEKLKDAAPKPEDGASYRAVLAAAAKLPEGQRWAAIKVLRKWSKGRSFGGDEKAAAKEFTAWVRWFNQVFPKETALPDPSQQSAEGKYKFADLKKLIESPEGKGDPLKGKLVFTKANCAKCHKFGDEGQGVGPDLSAISKRFKRVETLEAVIYPSKVISDQYRSTTVVTAGGQTLNGILADEPGGVSLTLADATKVAVKKADVEERYASLVSVMPEKLFDELSKQEIADLFAYLETEVPAAKK